MDKAVDVLWLSYHEPEILARGYWDQGLLEDVFKQGGYEHHVGRAEVTAFLDANDAEEVPENRKGAIVIINGRTHIEDTEEINADIHDLRWVLFIETGDEEATFPWREVKHPRMRVWMQLPRMNQHDDVSFRLPNGYRPTTHDTLQIAGYQDKSIDWMFAGQVNHARREQCVQELTFLRDSGTIDNGILVTTKTFGAEAMEYGQYLRQLARTRIAPCPSGIESPDNFRLYEALEAGCLPVVDAFSTNNQTLGFWRYLFGDDIPFPIVGYWDELIKLMPELLKDYPRNANRCFAWWQQRKRAIRFKLIDDVEDLSK